MTEIDLRDFPYMPLYIERLKKSKAWLQCKRRPELAFYLLNLWMRSWHEVPAGSVEDDDDVLADAALCPLPRWLKIRGDVLRNWEKKEDGRLYHSTVTELASESWQSKVKQRNRTAAARAAKLLQDQLRAATECVTISVTDNVIGDVTASKGREGKEEGKETRKDKTPNGASAAKYAFEGKIIKLNPKHFSDWSKAYSYLDLRGELIAREAWFDSDRATDADRKNWFISTSKYLANRNMEAKGKTDAAKNGPSPRWQYGIEGVT